MANKKEEIKARRPSRRPQGRARSACAHDCSAREACVPVDWVPAGGGLEVDRRVLEARKDPLIHLVRNAVDHGIEPPKARVEADKAARGRVGVSVASLEGGRIEIRVEDDGRGIDLARVREAAARTGLLAREAAEAIAVSPRTGVGTAVEMVVPASIEAASFLLTLALAASSHAQEAPQTVEVHGFASWAYRRTDGDNTYLSGMPGGSHGQSAGSLVVHTPIDGLSFGVSANRGDTVDSGVRWVAGGHAELFAGPWWVRSEHGKYTHREVYLDHITDMVPRCHAEGSAMARGRAT